MRTTFLLVIAGSILAAAGQIFLKLGATGASSLAGFINSRVLVGFGLYGCRFSAVDSGSGKAAVDPGLPLHDPDFCAGLHGLCDRAR